MLIDEVVGLLESAGVGVFGVDIFASAAAILPTSGRCMTIIETDGIAPIRTQGDGTIPAIQQPTFQLLARASSEQDAMAFLVSAYDVLAQVRNSTLGATFYLRLSPRQDPFPLGKDGNDRAMVAVNFIGMKRFS